MSLSGSKQDNSATYWLTTDLMIGCRGYLFVLVMNCLPRQEAITLKGKMQMHPTYSICVHHSTGTKAVDN